MLTIGIQVGLHALIVFILVLSLNSWYFQNFQPSKAQSMVVFIGCFIGAINWKLIQKQKQGS